MVGHVMREFILAWVQRGSPTARRWPLCCDGQRQLLLGLAHLRLWIEVRSKKVKSEDSGDVDDDDGSRVAESLEKAGCEAVVPCCGARALDSGG